MHYEKTFWYGIEGQVAGREFYLAPDGRDNPDSEREATQKALLDPALFPDNEHPLCRFPARRLLMQRENPNLKFPKVVCSELNKYLKRMDPEKVSYVFSAYYLNSPGSSFGHTFLRIAKKNNGQNELLDNGVSYAAEVTTQNPLLFVLYGILGGFRGVFSSLPYYYKIREYNDYESRDLFSYELNLTSEEIEMLVAHLWEVGNNHFTYYFITQNCAYHLLSVIEAAAPRLNLIENLPYQVLPSDSVKVLMQTNGLVSKVSYRPSSRTKFFHSLSKLNPYEKKLLKQALVKNEIPQGITVQVLDAVIDHWDYWYAPEVMEGKKSALSLRQKYLLTRSNRRETPENSEPPLPEEGRPDEGHGSRRITFSGGNETDKNAYLEQQYRFALHNRMDPPKGFPSSSLEMFGLSVREYLSPLSIEIETVTLFRAESLSLWQEFLHSISWRGFGGLWKVRDSGCDHCLVGGLTGGAGFSVAPINGMALSLLLDGGVGYSPKLTDTAFRLFAGPTFEIGVSPFSTLRFLISGNHSWLVTGPVPSVTTLSLEARWDLSSKVGVQVKGAILCPKTWDLSAGFNYFY